MRKEEFIMEGFKYYDEVSWFYGPEMMAIVENEGHRSECDEESHDQLWRRLFKKLEEINERGSFMLDFDKFDDEPELRRKFRETYTIGVSILVVLVGHSWIKGGDWCTKEELADWNIGDLSYSILDCMTEVDFRAKERQTLIDAFFILTQV